MPLYVDYLLPIVSKCRRYNILQNLIQWLRFFLISNTERLRSQAEIARSFDAGLHLHMGGAGYKTNKNYTSFLGQQEIATNCEKYIRVCATNDGSIRI